MRKLLIHVGVVITFLSVIAITYAYSARRVTDNEAGFETIQSWGDVTDVPEYVRGWERPEGPIRVGIQVGHWKLDEIPEELNGLLRTSGAVGGGKKEWEVALAIAKEVALLLEAKGIVVDILPAAIPPQYFADAFIAIHADGSPDTTVSGFKAASPYRDISGKAETLVTIFYEEYEKATGMKEDFNVTRRMKGYYAFNWRRYEHSIHPMTPAIIVETGFLTSPADRRILINNPKVSAEGIANTVISFFDLKAQGE